MKKKILIIILIILIIILAVVCTLKVTNKFSKNKDEGNRDSILISNTSSPVNTHGENSGVYVGVYENEKENFLFISIRIDKKASKEDQVKSLISSIADSIGYNIDINSAKIDGNKIKIDFAKTAAPFELTESFNPEVTRKYYVINDRVVPKTIFDSIDKTMKSYFGAETEVYFSTDSENINIENGNLTINIDANEVYGN